MNVLVRRFGLLTIALIGAIAAAAFALRWLSAGSLANESAYYEFVSEAPRVRFAAPTSSPEVDRLFVDGKLIRKIEQRCLGGFIDWHFAYRVECARTILDSLIETYSMSLRQDEPLRDLRDAFLNTFPDAREAIDRGNPILASPRFEPRSRGHDGDHYAALYDDATSTLYLWARHNF